MKMVILALRKLGVDEWLILTVMALYAEFCTLDTGPGMIYYRNILDFQNVDLVKGYSCKSY